MRIRRQLCVFAAVVLFAIAGLTPAVAKDDVLDTQGTVHQLSAITGKPECEYWLNEIHLTDEGYRFLAGGVLNALRKIERRPLDRNYPDYLQ